MKRTIPVLVLGVALAGIAYGVPGQKATQTKAVPLKPCVALTGPDSHLTKPEYHRITSMKDWVALWRKHKGQKPVKDYELYLDRMQLPIIDFDHYMVIAIFQGTHWNSDGLKAISLSPERDRIVLRFDDKSYQTWGKDSAKKVNAYGFFVIPRSSKPVVLEENVQNSIGAPPKWKERVAFPKIRPK